MRLKQFLRLLAKPIIERKFSYSSYEGFLQLLSNNDNYQIVPMRDIQRLRSDKQIIFSLRHDVDFDLKGALEMAKIEYKYNIKATYFILHTANYYGITKKGYVKHNKRIIQILLQIQNDYGHEIGWHNNLVTLDCIYGINPKKYLESELDWLRNNGINIVGTAAHGSSYCQKYGYHNNYFFYDFAEKLKNLPNNVCVNIDDMRCKITKAHLSDFGFEYEAYNVEHKFEFADCIRIGKEQRRWHPEDMDCNDFQPGEKIIVLIHPDHWDNSILRKYLKLISIGLRTS